MKEMLWLVGHLEGDVDTYFGDSKILFSTRPAISDGELATITYVFQFGRLSRINVSNVGKNNPILIRVHSDKCEFERDFRLPYNTAAAKRMFIDVPLYTTHHYAEIISSFHRKQYYRYPRLEKEERDIGLL